MFRKAMLIFVQVNEFIHKLLDFLNWHPLISDSHVVDQVIVPRSRQMGIERKDDDQYTLRR